MEVSSHKQEATTGRNHVQVQIDCLDTEAESQKGKREGTYLREEIFHLTLPAQGKVNFQELTAVQPIYFPHRDHQQMDCIPTTHEIFFRELQKAEGFVFFLRIKVRRGIAFIPSHIFLVHLLRGIHKVGEKFLPFICLLSRRGD